MAKLTRRLRTRGAAAALLCAAIQSAGCSAAPPASPTAAPSGWRGLGDLPALAGGELLAVARSTSVIVAVGRHGEDGGVWTSSDGTAWTIAPAADIFTGVEIAGVTFANGKFVAVGSRVGSGAAEGHFEAWTSTDGMTWSLAPEEQAIFAARGVAAGGPGFVAGGSELQDVATGTYAARAATSPDGIAWTPAETGAFDGARMDAIAAGSGAIVAGGSTSGFTPAAAAFWVSTDGSAWTRLPDDPGFAGAAVGGISAGPGGFVAVGSTSLGGAAVWTSSDGQAWSRVPEGPAFAGARMQSVAAAGPGYVAVGYGPEDAAVWTSTDGKAWERDPGGTHFAGGQMFGIVPGTPTVIVGRGVPSAGAKGLVWVPS